MRSKKVEFWMPWDVYERAIADRKARGYDSLGRYFIGLSLQSVLESTRHQARVLFANQNPKRQDDLIRRLNEMQNDPDGLLMMIEQAGLKKPSVSADRPPV
jgi:hypothetical protein